MRMYFVEMVTEIRYWYDTSSDPILSMVVSSSTRPKSYSTQKALIMGHYYCSISTVVIISSIRRSSVRRSRAHHQGEPFKHRRQRSMYVCLYSHEQASTNQYYIEPSCLRSGVYRMETRKKKATTTNSRIFYQEEHLC